MTTQGISSPSWTDEELRQAYFSDFQSTNAALEEHPGSAVERSLSEMRISVDLFVETADDLTGAIHDFKAASNDPMFWSRAHRAEFDRIERRIRKTLFAAASAALALVDHARRTNDRFPLAEYADRRREAFDEEQHRFIQDLRNFASHVATLIPEWERRYANRTRETRLLLLPQFLLRYENWKGPARTFIEKHPHGIELDTLFSDYRGRVTAFYRWYFQAIEDRFGASLAEYRRYRRTLDQFGVHSFWMMLLSQVVIPRKLNPFDYLPRYLTATELAEVSSLPPRSREQVDRIISLIDDVGACDERLRELVYRAFEVGA